MREKVTETELLALLNENLRMRGVPEGYSFGGPVHRLAEPDESGCNWSWESLSIRGSGVSITTWVGREAYASAADVAARFNLSEGA